jgi:hypothetical protein
MPRGHSSQTFDVNSAQATTLSRSATQNRTAAIWQNRSKLATFVRYKFGSKCDGSEARNNRLSLMCNEDIKSRISYSKNLLPLSDPDLSDFIVEELAAGGLGAHTFDESALHIIVRAVQGNLRLCRNLCYASLLATCLDNKRICTASHVNAALVQPHWRSHEALLKQQEPKATR